MQARLILAIAVVAGFAFRGQMAQQPSKFLPGQDILLDAHNAYADQDRWNDRFDRALRTGTPLAIEQDLVWSPATAAVPAHSIVSHSEPFTGRELMLRDVFELIRPIATRAIELDSRDQWPIITLNLDFKDSRLEHFAAVWDLLGEYERWLTTAPRVADAASVQPFNVGPVLVLTGAMSKRRWRCSS